MLDKSVGMCYYIQAHQVVTEAKNLIKNFFSKK